MNRRTGSSAMNIRQRNKGRRTVYKDCRRQDLTGDYVILDKTAYDASGNALDVKIGVIGFAEDYGASVGYKKFEALGYSITEDYDEVDRLAEELEEEKGCDATILLAHGAADRIAESLGSSTAVDLVYGGHTHKAVSFGINE